MTEVRKGSRFGPLAISGDEIIIGDELGHGAFGKVFSCRKVRSGDKEWAVKVIEMRQSFDGAVSDSELGKIDNEIRILLKVAHERCVYCDDIFRSPDGRSIMLVMECVRGGELFAKVVSKGKFNEFEAKHVFKQVLAGLDCLHRQKIIHRDLKVENVLVSDCKATADGELFDIKLCDYGLSKVLEAGAKARTKCGTEMYWAPEVHQGSCYDASADMWSAGVLLYVMLVGKYPFEGNSDMRANVLAGKFEQPPLWHALSPGAKEVIGGLLTVNPAQRFTLNGCCSHLWLGGGCGSPKRPSVGFLVGASYIAQQEHGHAEVVVKSSETAEGHIVAKVPNGQHFRLLADDGGDYVKVRSEAGEGYAKRGNLQPTMGAAMSDPPSTQPAEGALKLPLALVAMQEDNFPEVAVKDAPSPAGTMIALVPNGQPFIQRGDSGDYLRVGWQSPEGVMMDGYVKKTNVHHATRPVCLLAGCGKPTWNGEANQFCGSNCTAAAKASVCLLLGCGKPTWNGQSNEYCSKVCRGVAVRSKTVLPPAGGGKGYPCAAAKAP